MRVKRKLSPDRVFYMGRKTGFFSKRANSKKCVARSRGFKTTCGKIMLDSNFHLIITECVASTGFVLPPPMFVFPIQLLNRDVADECTIEGSLISVCPEGIHELRNIY